MSKPVMNAKTKKLLLGIAALAVIAVIVFFFPQLLPSDDGTLTAPAASGSTAAAATTAPEASKPTSAPPAASDTAKTPETTQAPETEKSSDRSGFIPQRRTLRYTFTNTAGCPRILSPRRKPESSVGQAAALKNTRREEHRRQTASATMRARKKAGRTYTECDIDTRGASSRGAKRIVFFKRRAHILYRDQLFDL